MFAIGEWQRVLAELCEKHNVPGAQVGVLTADGEVRVVAAGLTSLSTRVEVDDATLFQYGSVTKVWTTTLVMQLVDEGALTLDTPVADILPDFRIAEDRHGGAVTVEHLLTHTSGIVGDLFTDTGDGAECIERYVESLATAPSVTPPGGPLSYCNAGFVVAGRILEVLRGSGWDDVVAERIAEPLGLRHVITSVKDAPLYRTAVGHLTKDDALVPTRRWMLPRALGPAGLITGNAADLLRFAAMHLRDGVGLTGERVLSESSARLMRERHVDLSAVSTVNHGWGLGWMLADWTRDGEPVATVKHGGSTYGQDAYLHVFPEQDVAFCVLTNSDKGPALIRDVERRVGEELGLTPPAPLVTDTGDLTPALGVYETPISTVKLYREADGQHYLDVASKLPDAGTPPPPMPVRPVGGGRFTISVSGSESEGCHVVHDGADFLYLNRLFQRVAT